MKWVIAKAGADREESSVRSRLTNPLPPLADVVASLSIWNDCAEALRF
jgi:hypothetical protein